MKGKTKNPVLEQKHKYNLAIATIITLAIVVMASVWMIYNHKSEELEKEILLLK